ncbi:MAG TPA: hypothetical protein VKB26_10600 [Candidatus Acidoferrales bacterium]|nr:hypothetical protein [Candidatus Acidoferrales bacterium]
MKRAITITILACIAAIIVFAYFHHRKLVKLREAFDAPSPAPATTTSTPPSSQISSSEPAAPDLVHQLPAGASAVVFMDVAALRSSSFANELANLAPTSAEDPAYTEFVRDTGFDYSRDLDRAAVDLWPQTSSTSVLALAQGRFDEAKIERYALHYGRLVKIHNRKVYEVREENSTRLIHFTFLSPTEIALADGPDLSQVLGTTNSTRLDSQMSERVALVSGTPIYAVARTQDLPKDIGLDVSHSAQLAGLLRSVHAISASGRPAENNLKIFASAECDSTLDALKLSTALQGLLWIGRAALADPKTQQQIGPQWPGFDALLKAADISHNSRHVELRVEVTPQMMQAMVAVPANVAPEQH